MPVYAVKLINSNTQLLVAILITVIIIIYLFKVDKMVCIVLDKNNFLKRTKCNRNPISLLSNLNILYYLTVLSKSGNYCMGSLNKTYLVNICFAWPAGTGLRAQSFIQALKPTSNSLALFSFEKYFHNLRPK